MSFTILCTLPAEPFFRLLVLRTRYFHIAHNTPCLPLTFCVMLCVTVVPRESENNVYSEVNYGQRKNDEYYNQQFNNVTSFTIQYKSSQGIIFNYKYETIRTCARYHRRSWNSLWAKLLTANWKLQSLTRSPCYIFLKPPSRIAKVLISGWECKAAYESIWYFF